MPSPDTPAADAFILTGAYWLLSRNPRYLEQLAARGIAALVITPARWREPALREASALAASGAPVAEYAFVDGDPNAEGAFIPGAVAAARRWTRDYTILGVLAVGETVLEATGLIADGLGLPSPGLRATKVCRAKHLQRWYLPEFAPESLTVPPEGRECFDWASAPTPAVLKPATRNSSSGVLPVTEPSTLRGLFTRYPPQETLLVEERIEGQEYSVESLVSKGRTVFSSVTRKDTTDSHAETFVELVHTVPEPEAGPRALLLEANQRLLDRLEFEDGICHSEWRVDAEGRGRLMEAAARTPGDGLMPLYRLATGEALERHVVAIALGEEPVVPRVRRYARQVYLEHEPGVLDDVDVDWPEPVNVQWIGEKGLWPALEPGPEDQPPTLRAVLVLKDRGAVLGPLLSSDDRAVTFLIDARTPAELDELERRVRKAIRVRTVPADQEAAGARVPRT